MTTADYLNQLEQDREDLVDNLETKGITGLTGDETFTELVPEVLNIPSGGTTKVEEKDVNFYDYDGTRLHSYTKSEFLLLESLPSNPTHEGLTSQGWNWSLADAKTYVTDYNKLNVGQMYATSDGATRIYIELEGRKSPYLCFAVNGTATIDWGDNTTNTVTGNDTTTLIKTQHNYSSNGNYVISISSSSTIYFMANPSKKRSTILNYDITETNQDFVYLNAIKKIELGNVNIDFSYAFAQCYSLKSITIPNTVTGLGGYTFKYCYSLQSITIPNSVTSTGGLQNYQYCYSLDLVILPNTITSIGNASFQNCMALSSLVIPSSVTSIEQSAFNTCQVLSSLIIPKNVATIGGSSFSACNGIGYLDFSHHTEVPTLVNTAAFTGVASDFKIIVPDSLYNDWIVADKWSTYSSNIIKKTDWDSLNS